MAKQMERARSSLPKITQLTVKTIRLTLKWSRSVGIRSKLREGHDPGALLVWKKCYGFTYWLGGPECCEEGEQRKLSMLQASISPSRSLSAHSSPRETSLTISQCSRSANAGFYKRCSARQQGVPRLRLMSTQMQADSSGINNLISLHLFLLPLSPLCFLKTLATN